MKKCSNKYCLKYVLRNAILISCIVIPISMLLLVVRCIYNTIDGHITEIFFPIICGAVIFLLSNLSLINFYNIINEQEQKYGMTFNDKNAEKLCALIYLTDEWLIDCGTKTVPRKSIKGINYIYQHSRGGIVIKITLFTDDIVYKIHVFNLKQVDKLCSWVNNA